jgi:hypothetical protein
MGGGRKGQGGRKGTRKKEGGGELEGITYATAAGTSSLLLPTQIWNPQWCMGGAVHQSYTISLFHFLPIVLRDITGFGTGKDKSGSFVRWSISRSQFEKNSQKSLVKRDIKNCPEKQKWLYKNVPK